MKWTWFSFYSFVFILYDLCIYTDNNWPPSRKESCRRRKRLSELPAGRYWKRGIVRSVKEMVLKHKNSFFFLLGASILCQFLTNRCFSHMYHCPLNRNFSVPFMRIAIGERSKECHIYIFSNQSKQRYNGYKWFCCIETLVMRLSYISEKGNA